MKMADDEKRTDDALDRLDARELPAMVVQQAITRFGDLGLPGHLYRLSVISPNAT